MQQRINKSTQITKSRVSKMESRKVLVDDLIQAATTQVRSAYTGLTHPFHDIGCPVGVLHLSHTAL